MAGANAPGTVQVTGAKELRAALKRMGQDTADLSAIHREAARVVAEAAEARAPRRSGKLAGTIKGKATKTRAQVVVGSRLVPHAGPIHFGWLRHNIDPNPFLYDALDDRGTQVVNLYEKRIGDLVERVGRETP